MRPVIERSRGSGIAAIGPLDRETEMPEPLSKSQQRLRGRMLAELSDEQIRDWIDACHKMENWVKASKARRGWRLSGIEAGNELERRASPLRPS